VHVPDRSIVAALQRIDKGLSVAFVDPPGRWGVFHALQMDGNPDAEIDRLAELIQLDGLRMGYVLDKHSCGETARAAVTARNLVCYVVDDDGGYRSLDGRIVEKLQRMDYYRRNLGLRDWRQMLDAKADVVRKSRQTAQGDVWACIKRDPVFARQVSDILWGVRPVRSIIVPDTYGGEHDADPGERDEQAAAGAPDRAEADADRGDGSGVAAAPPDDGAVRGDPVHG